MAGFPGVDLPQCWLSDGGEAGAENIPRLSPDRFVQGLRHLLWVPFYTSTGLRVPVLTFSSRASCLTFLLVI